MKGIKNLAIFPSVIGQLRAIPIPNQVQLVNKLE
jgi:hypothetical protein